MSLRTAKEALHHINDRFDEILGEMEKQKNFKGYSSEFVHKGEVYGLKLYRSNNESSKP